MHRPFPSLAGFSIASVRRLLHTTDGSAILEFAISVPLLVVFIVGIYDFAAAFNEKQKIGQAAQEGAIVAASQPTNDISVSNGNPDSLQPVVTAVVNSLNGSGVLTPGNCVPPWAATGGGGLTWTYTLSGCSNIYPFSVVVTINRGAVLATGPPAVVGSTVTVSFPHKWPFANAIQLLFPGSSSYAGQTTLTEMATVNNQT